MLKNIIQINHVRSLINGALTGIGVSFVPRCTVENELHLGVLCNVFPDGQLMDDYFCIYIKNEKRGILKKMQMIAFLLERCSGFEA